MGTLPFLTKSAFYKTGWGFTQVDLTYNPKVFNPPMELRLSSSQLRRAATIQERIEQLERELDQLLSSSGGGRAQSRQTTASRERSSNQRQGGGRNISSAGRARIAEAQRKRWASFRKKSGKPKPAVANLGRGKRRFSRGGLSRISQAQKERWAKYRNEQARAAA
jgi:hypothetical protein